MPRLLLASGLLAFAGLFAACGGDAPPTISVTAQPSTFTSGSTVTFTVTVQDFELRPDIDHQMETHGLHQGLKTSTEDGHEGGDGHHDEANEEYVGNAGHFHVYLDSVETNPIKQSWDTTVMLPIVADPGAHTLIFRLNDDSHRFFVPHITATVDVTVQ